MSKDVDVKIQSVSSIRRQNKMLGHSYTKCQHLDSNSDVSITSSDDGDSYSYSSRGDSFTTSEASSISRQTSSSLSRQTSKYDTDVETPRRKQSYTVMMVANTDFYIANPKTENNQIEYMEHPPDQIQNGNLSTTTSTIDSIEISPVKKKDFDNPVFQREDADAKSDTKSDSSAKSTSSDSFYNTDLRYGWLCFTADFLQRLNRPVFFVLCMVISGVAQGLVITGVAFTVITSIEKQFGLSSTQVGLFGTLYDTGYGIFCVFVGYFGHRHKPRSIGLGLILMCIGCFVTSIPKYIIGSYKAGIERDSDYCAVGANSAANKDCESSSEWYYVFIFMLGNVLMGIGATPLYTLAPSHIDEIAERGQGALYTGIYYAGAALGPGLGFIIGKPILNTWVDLTQPANSNLDPTDRNWVGAWWIGYLVGAACLFVPVIPVLGFPRIFPNSEAVKERKKELEDTIEEDENLKNDLKSVWPATLGLLKNKPYIFLCLSISAESLAIGGFSTFIPKLVETQFHFTASDSALYTGLIVVPGAAGGILLGGYLIYRFGWNCKQTLKGSGIMALIATVCVCTALVGCDGRTVVGSSQEGYYNISGPISLNNSCNNDCHCSLKYYKPICSHEDQKTYFSPCHAGCAKENMVDDKFYNCSCLPPEITHAIDGRCTPDCTLFPLFVVGAFLLMFFTFMNNVPMINATFRVVPEGQGSFAMGFQQVFVRFLGFIPAPTMFGKLIDMSCDLWGVDECTGDTTSCLEYHNENFRYYMFILGVITKFMSFVFIFLAYKTYQLPKTDSTTPSSTTPTPQNTNKIASNGNLYDMKEIAAITNVHNERMKSPEPSVLV